MEQKILYISGMHCPACDILIREIIQETDGIELISFTASGVLMFIYSDEKTLSALKQAITESGYTVSNSQITKKLNRKEIVLLLSSGIGIWLLLYNLDIATYAGSL